jgi:hypothetical protein
MQFAAAYSLDKEDLVKDYLRQRRINPVTPDSKYKAVFKPRDKSKGIRNYERLRERHLTFWSNMDQQRTEILNQWLGPRNLWEEQIEWTNKGKMWPYPINNEYLVGEEENVRKSKNKNKENFDSDQFCRTCFSPRRIEQI